MIGIITAFLYLIQNDFNVILREQCRLLAENFFLSIPLSRPVTIFTHLVPFSQLIKLVHIIQVNILHLSDVLVESGDLLAGNESGYTACNC